MIQKSNSQIEQTILSRPEFDSYLEKHPWVDSSDLMFDTIRILKETPFKVRLGRLNNCVGGAIDYFILSLMDTLNGECFSFALTDNLVYEMTANCMNEDPLFGQRQNVKYVLKDQLSFKKNIDHLILKSKYLKSIQKNEIKFRKIIEGIIDIACLAENKFSKVICVEKLKKGGINPKFTSDFYFNYRFGKTDSIAFAKNFDILSEKAKDKNVFIYKNGKLFTVVTLKYDSCYSSIEIEPFNLKYYQVLRF